MNTYANTILFICYANVGRSQMAEGFWNAYSHASRAVSAGIRDYSHKHKYPDTVIINLMKEKGIDISHHTVKKLTPAMVQNANRVVVLCKKSRCPKYVFEHPRVYYKHIKDPYKQSPYIKKLIRNQIDAFITSLLEQNTLEL